MATPKKKHPKKAGRHTSYRPEYCNQMLEYFGEDPNSERDLEYTNPKTGEIKQTVKIIPNKFPTLEGFADIIDVSCQTMLSWCEKFPEFLETYTRCKEKQKNFLIQNGLTGLYESKFAIFVAKNCTDMKDKTEQENNVTGSISITITDATK